ncbi:LysR family transcriptional regulator [Aeribacillus composti]|uniref:LysR family transcriptional regulator n=1 Tax=Aeribacillus composti TaxID=1868734 RepID=UPI002E1C0F98|nr:LysR family transcriptional regulator [Aeribacillus composti]
MELRVLRYFVTVARMESITKAAEILHVTQPTLSRQLADLEEELGTQLFIRGKKRISLTEDGMLLLRRAEEILAISDRTVQEFKDRNNLVGGTISIGSIEALTSQQVLSKMITAFNSEYPQVSYHIFTGIGDDIKEKLDSGLLEIGILLEPINYEKYHFIRLQQTERWGILTRTSSPLAQKDHVRPRDLIGEPLMMSSRIFVQNKIASWFGDAYADLHIVATFTLISNVINLAETGFGTAVCIEGVSKQHYSKDLCFIPFYPELKSNYVIVWKKHTTMNRTSTRFIQFIKHTLKA